MARKERKKKKSNKKYGESRWRFDAPSSSIQTPDVISFRCFFKLRCFDQVGATKKPFVPIPFIAVVRKLYSFFSFVYVVR